MFKKGFYDHFNELNRRIIFSLTIFFIFSLIVYLNYKQVYKLLIDPLLKAGYLESDLVAFTIYEGFQVKIFNTLLVSFILSFPFLSLIIGLFIKPALEKTSNVTFYLYLFTFLLLFYVGLYASYKTLPFGINFLLSFNESNVILRTQNYFQLISRVALLFGISFQSPLIIYFLIKKKIIKVTLFTSNRKELFIIIVIISAIITPTGDPITLFIFAIPMYLLIEIVLYLNKET